jgi:hypothetical protein
VQKSIIEREFARTTYTFLGSFSLLLILFIWIGCVAWIPGFINDLNGAIPVSKNDVENIVDEYSLPHYISVTGDEVSDTGFKSDYNHYLALRFGDRLLLVKAPHVTDSLTFKGSLERLSEDDKHTIIHHYEKHASGSAARFLPAKLRVLENHKVLTIVTILFLLAVFAVIVAGFVVGVIRAVDRTKHPLWKALSRYGNPSEIASQIDSEFAQPGTFKLGKVHLSRSWLLYQGFGFSSLFSLAHVVWVYKATRRGSLVSTSLLYSIIRQLFPRYYLRIAGTSSQRLGQYQVPGSSAADQLIEQIKARAPWAIIGFTNEHQQAWTRDYKLVVQRVMENRDLMK